MGSCAQNFAQKANERNVMKNHSVRKSGRKSNKLPARPKGYVAKNRGEYDELERFRFTDLVLACFERIMMSPFFKGVAIAGKVVFFTAYLQVSANIQVDLELKVKSEFTYRYTPIEKVQKHHDNFD